MKGKVYSYKTKNKGLQWGFVHDAPISTKKRNQIRKTGYSTEKEASSAMRKSISDYEAGKLELSDMKVADVIQLYLDYAKNEGKREKGTITNYEGVFKNHLQSLKDRSVKTIKQVEIQDWQRELHNKGVSDNVFNCCVKLLKVSFNHAIELELLQVNPFRRLKAKQIPKKHRNRFSVEELQELFSICYSEFKDYYCIFAISVMTGMRVGEYIALQTSDINLSTNVISVSKQLTRNDRHKPKTLSSTRDVDISDKLANIIKWHIDTFDIKDGDFLFRADEGGLLYQKWVERKFKRLLILAGYDENYCRVHDLRGQYVDLMHYLNVDIEYISKQVGHSDSKITSKTYSEILKCMPVKANKALDSLIFPKNSFDNLSSYG